MEVSAFTAMARAEFAQGYLDALARPFPAAVEKFVTKLPSSARAETHLFTSSLPRLKRFFSYTPAARIVSNEYTVYNYPYRAAVTVKRDDIADDQVGLYMKLIEGLPSRAQKDIQEEILKHLAAGKTKKCFDGTNFFDDSHTVGVGDNKLTYDGTANDAKTFKLIALVCENSVKPVIFQDREALTGLQTDAESPQAAKLKEYEYWVDSRFGLGYGFWWDGIFMDITDTPKDKEVIEIVETLISAFRSFKLPNASADEDSIYVHEGWVPSSENFVLIADMNLEPRLRTVLSRGEYADGSVLLTHPYKDVATIIGTSALN